MDKDAIHAKSVGDRAGMLSASASKGDERVSADIVAAGHRNLLNGVGHIFDSDSEKSACQAFGRKFGLSPRAP